MRYLFAAAACLLAAGCTQPRVQLQPSEVLHASVVASNTLDSFSYALQAGIRLSEDGIAAMTGALRIDGTLRRERTIATGIGSMEVARPGPLGMVMLRIDGAYALVPQQRPAIRVDGVSTASGGVMLQRDTERRWISLPLEDSPSPMQSASRIDQRWIALQTSALQVTKDLGLAEVDGRDAYHYAVALDVDALQAMFAGQDSQELRDTLRDRLNGEVWIDADTFLLQRAVWRLSDLQMPEGSLSMDLDVAVFDHNRAQAQIAPPMPNEIEYPDDAIFATIFSGALLPFMHW